MAASSIEEKLKQVEELTEAAAIAEHVSRMLMSAGQYPKFSDTAVPIAVAAKVFNKDATWVRQGIIDGWLPIGISTTSSGGGRTNFYISPKLLWELTGFVYLG